MNWNEFKDKCEHLWRDMPLEIELDAIFGAFYMQPGTRWRSGLRADEIGQLEQLFGFAFPYEYKTMLAHIRGLDRKHIDVFDGVLSYSWLYYQYPEDMDKVKFSLDNIAEFRGDVDHALRCEGYQPHDVIGFIPLYMHRVLAVFPDPSLSPVLSIFGNDVIVYAHSLNDYMQQEFIDKREEEYDLLLRGNKHYRLGNYQLALACYNEVIALAPEWAAAWSSRARNHYADGQFEAAVADFQMALTQAKLVPECELARDYIENDEAQYLRGLALCTSHLKRNEEALQHIEASLAIVRSTDSLCTMAGILSTLGRTEQALAAVDEALRMDAECATSWSTKADIELNRGQARLALDDVKRALKLTPEDAKFHDLASQCYSQLGDQQQAALAKTRAEEVREDEFCQGLVEKGHLDEALARQEVLVLKSLSASRLYNMAVTLLALGKFARALTAVSQALDEDETHGAAWLIKAKLLLRFDRVYEAINCADRAKKLMPDEKNVDFTVSDCSAALEILELDRLATIDGKSEIPDGTGSFEPVQKKPDMLTRVRNGEFVLRQGKT